MIRLDRSSPEDWEEIQGFRSPGEFRVFEEWIAEALAEGAVTEVDVAAPYSGATFTERWFRASDGGVWRMVRPDPPFRGVFERVQREDGRTDPSGWILSRYDTERQDQHRATFRGWASCGERTHYAWAEVDPAFELIGSEGTEAVRVILLAPRHEGVRLDEADQDWPIHVHVLTVPHELLGSSHIPVDAVKIRAWALLSNPPTH